MNLFIVFIVGAVLLGAGGMLSPAWRTAQPRVALAATLCLALLLGGAVFYAEAFGWDTLVVDYLLFILLSGVVLGGTLSTAQARAEARGETLADRDQGWPGPQDLAFFALVALALLIPLLRLPAALGDAGQVIGLHSLTARDGGSFDSLAPYYPGEQVLVAPGLHALSAWLSQQLDQPIPRIHFSLAAVSVFLTVWLAYDLGSELRDKRLGRALAVAIFCGGGLQFSLLDGHHAELLALPFLLAFLIYALRCRRHFHLADLIAGGLMLGAVAYTSLSIGLVALLAFALFSFLLWVGERRMAASTRLAITLGMPLIALLGIAPWLANSLPRMLEITPSPYPPDLAHLAEMLRGPGLVIAPLAIWGIAVAFRQRIGLRWLMLLWLLLILDLSLTGALGRPLPGLGDLVNAPNLARHGTLAPLSYFAGIALLHCWDARLPSVLKTRLRERAYPMMAGVALILIALGWRFPSILAALSPALDLPPQTLTYDDLAAMSWLRDSTPESALLLASDGEGWLPIVAERPALDFRAARYFEWNEATASDATRETADYVFQSRNGVSLPPLPLRLVYQQGEARVYAVESE